MNCILNNVNPKLTWNNPIIFEITPAEKKTWMYDWYLLTNKKFKRKEKYKKLFND